MDTHMIFASVLSPLRYSENTKDERRVFRRRNSTKFEAFLDSHGSDHGRTLEIHCLLWNVTTLWQHIRQHTTTKRFKNPLPADRLRQRDEITLIQQGLCLLFVWSANINKWSYGLEDNFKVLCLWWYLIGIKW